MFYRRSLPSHLEDLFVPGEGFLVEPLIFGTALGTPT